MENETDGKKRLSIKIVGHDWITAFVNDKKTATNHPDYKGDGVAVWVHTKKQAEINEANKQEPNVSIETV
jgi:hypothetical protein